MALTSLPRRAVAEAIGTALLLAIVVGSGIMGERLADGNVAIALLANTLATGAGLVALILAFGPISGAHFNPMVTLADATQGGLPWKAVPVYLLAQIIGALVGLPVCTLSRHERHGAGQLLSEGVATFGLLAVIWGSSRNRPSVVPFAVGAYITAGYWFTASTAMANPAVTVARSLTDTFSGIRPMDVPAFIVVQIIGAAAGTGLFRWLVPTLRDHADEVVVPHSTDQKIFP
jgi:glycerol uptake facilitator-like aquaporin